MMLSRECIRFFVDHCVPASVSNLLRESGHEVILLREWIPPDSPDAVVAAVAELNDAVLVSMDADFKKIAARIPKGQRARFRKLDHLRLECPEPQAAARLRLALFFGEAEYQLARLSKPRQRMIVSIGKDVLRTHR